MKWILVVMISLCWCEVDASKCRNPSECQKNMLNDWNDKKYGPYILQKAERDYLEGNDVESRASVRLGVRQECRTLSDEKRNDLFDAFKWLFTTRPLRSKDTRYQIFMSQHRRENAPGAHGGPCFPGWHREYLTRFERALKVYNREVSLCYWDSSLDYSLPDAIDSALWTPEYFGNDNGYVTTGFAANLSAYPPDCARNRARLYRQIGSGRNSWLFNQNKINVIFRSAYNFTQFMSPPAFEGYHGGVHMFVGGEGGEGHMSNLNCAVTDPVFWLHHTYIDYLWEKCRQIQVTDKETDYPRDSDSEDRENHNANAPMKPFLHKTCLDGLSNSYIPGYYSYLDTPASCTTHAKCGGKAVWCNSGKCTASVRADGRMGATWPNNACYITNCPTPRNVNQVCTCAP